MRALGVVCEYNPFHLGHLYHLEESRRQSGAEVLVCVMSGDFVQRGEAAMLSKFARAEAACRAGADLVLELPLPWSLSSAETFASGAVSILAAVGCSGLSFGSEAGQLYDLDQLAALLLEAKTKDQILDLLKTDASLSYAKARQQVLKQRLGEKASLLSMPNNILAVEYLKAVLREHPGMTAIAIERRGAGHDSLRENEFPSAKNLRTLYMAGESIRHYLPPESAMVLEREAIAGRIHRPDVMEGLLRSRLYQLRAEDFDQLPDAGDGAGRRLYKTLREGRSLQETVELASSKRYAKARIRRMLLCAALGLCAELTENPPPYARLLACGERGRRYLAEEKDSLTIPVLTKPAAVKKLHAGAQKVFILGARAHDLTVLQYRPEGDILLGEDWKKGPVLV